MRVGINGMGRIGRLALRAAMGAADRGGDDPRRDNRLDIVHVNEIKGGTAATAHLLEFDSVQGRWRETIAAENETAIRIGGKRIGFSSHSTAVEIPWGDLGVDLVLECTGKFLNHSTLDGHLKRGAKRVIVAAPVKKRMCSTSSSRREPSSLLYDPAKHPIVTAASCTTNCLAPVVKVVHESLGIRHGQITTIHDPTNTNVVVDAPHKDLRRARSAMLSLQADDDRQCHRHRADLSGPQGKARWPRSAGAGAQCLAHRLRVRVEPRHHPDEVNALFEAAASGPLAGLLGYEPRPLVSADYARDTRFVHRRRPFDARHRRHAAQGLCLV